MFLLKLGSELQNLIKKIPIRSEDIKKMQTEFLQVKCSWGEHCAWKRQKTKWFSDVFREYGNAILERSGLTDTLLSELFCDTPIFNYILHLRLSVGFKTQLSDRLKVSLLLLSEFKWIN